MLALGNNKLSPQQRLDKAVVAIMGNEKYRALAGILMIGDRSIKGDIPTACTNGRDEMYGHDFVDTLTDAELRFVVLHESFHKLYRHLTTWEWMWKEDADRANRACDYVINLQIRDENKDGFAVMPECGLIDEKYRGMNAAQVYKSLGDEPPGGGSGGSGGFDEHDWEGAKELTDAEQRDLERDIDEAIRQGALMAGKLGTGAERDLSDLLKPQVNWREVMREFVTSTCSGSDYSTYRRLNRRYVALDLPMPTGITETVEGIVVAGDMSGSIGQREMSVIVSEAKHCFDAVKPDWVRMLYWDTEVAGDEKYDNAELDNFVNTTKPRGGGGTDVSCVPPYMQEHGINPQAVIIITDGHLYRGWGQWSHPVLWVIIDNEDAKPDCGKYIHVTSEELRR
jgi:predicted metal-dependent peptidase